MIWIVTDHHETRKSLPKLIAEKGYPIREMDCGDEIHRSLQFQSPSLIIVDCGLPNSFETIKAVRKEHAARSIPVVMFSVNDENLKQQALLAGADGYIPKGSLDWAELLTEVVRYAGEKRAGE